MTDDAAAAPLSPVGCWPSIAIAALCLTTLMAAAVSGALGWPWEDTG